MGEYREPSGTGGTKTPTPGEVVVRQEAFGPLYLGLPAIGIGLLVLGMSYIGLPKAAVVTTVPIIAFAMGLFLVGATIWAARIGQGVIAAAFGMLSALGFAIATLSLGVVHGWWGLPATGAGSAQEMFFIAWAALFFFVTIPFLRIFPALGGILGFVTLFLILVTAGIAAVSTDLLMAGGASALVVALLCFLTFTRIATSVHAGGELGSEELGAGLGSLRLQTPITWKHGHAA